MTPNPALYCARKLRSPINRRRSSSMDSRPLYAAFFRKLNISIYRTNRGAVKMATNIRDLIYSVVACTIFASGAHAGAGVPDPNWGEAVKAVVELRPECKATESEMLVFCRERLGSVKAPKSVEFWSELPRSSVGKVLKRDIRAKFWAGRERMV